jgi:hypothetical protein
VYGFRPVYKGRGRPGCAWDCLTCTKGVRHLDLKHHEEDKSVKLRAYVVVEEKSEVPRVGSNTEREKQRRGDRNDVKRDEAGCNANNQAERQCGGRIPS